MFSFDRRGMLLALVAAMGGLSSKAISATSGLTSSALRLGAARPFSFESLQDQAKALAAKPYLPPPPPAAALAGIDFDKVQKIRFRPGQALWLGADMPYPVSFFHLNKYSQIPVKIFALDGPPEKLMAHEILYAPSYFEYGDSGLDPTTLGTLGFSGFRANDAQTSQSDWLAFQGASYFRTVGQDDQYGISARGIAINTATPAPEEFPRFTQFWLSEQDQTLTIYALLDG
ncbi:MAG TPA: glucan biosynthesis protein, partial [Rhizomicrobium sp.]|nr:glucan biosynthesis protein [Rhizomicrobium sp.]